MLNSRIVFLLKIKSYSTLKLFVCKVQVAFMSKANAAMCIADNAWYNHFILEPVLLRATIQHRV
ncbi:MAG: hypothetical protein DMF68_03865 [Acidobacteria bacterium]|nr:MAG: hypothetical protein DMF68_03865 [Acidobacteriota bacterium]